MSRHAYQYTCGNSKVIQVTLGWDRPLQEFFFSCEKINTKKGNRKFLIDSLELNSMEKGSLDIFVNATKNFGISLPPEIIEEANKDRDNDVGNKYVSWQMTDGKLIREEFKQ